VTTANVIAVTVDAGPPAAQGGTYNIPYVSVKLCRPGTSTCATITNVLVDTGSSGVRIMASALAAAGLTLTETPDPTNASNSIAECVPFADGYTWGPIATADVSLAGELASDVSVNIIDDNGSYAATPPHSCTAVLSSSNTSLNSVQAFAANGVLGVGTADQDCGDSCANCASYMNGCNTAMSDLYYSCNTGTNSCAFTPVSNTAQVRNPVSVFTVDNNGVILALEAIPVAGQTGATGTLTFGIDTQSNNALGSAFVLTLDSDDNFTTTFNGQSLTSSFIDSGSNGLFFPDSSIPACANSGSNPNASDFYCPTSTRSLTATNQNQAAATSVVNFQISNESTINSAFYADDALGGSASTTTSLGPYFDFGLPFFYGRSVFTAIEGKTAGTQPGPFYAY
jgi:hypothetical protein